jgi:hypothetical protein
VLETTIIRDHKLAGTTSVGTVGTAAMSGGNGVRQKMPGQRAGWKPAPVTRERSARRLDQSSSLVHHMIAYA